MMTLKRPTALALACALFLGSVLSAKLPEHSVILEAESMACPNQAWTTKPHFRGWYAGKPSGKTHLVGVSSTMGTATATIIPLKAGPAKLWVRYIDLSMYRSKSGFIVTVKQNGKELVRKTFDAPDKSLRKTPEGLKKWGSGFGQFVWDNVPLNLVSTAPLTLELDKLYPVAQTNAGGRHVDVFLLTPDLTYEPTLHDLNPWYFRVRILPEQKEPIAIHLFGKRSTGDKGWYTHHINVNRKGCFIGPDNGAGNMKDAHFKANDVSQWFNLGDEITFDGNDSLFFNAIVSYFQPRPKEANFEIQFANAPSDKAIRASYARRGKGNGLSVQLNAYADTITSEIIESKKDLERAVQATTPLPEGKRPRKFPFATGLSVRTDSSMPETMERELEVMERLGINTLTLDVTDRVQSFPFFNGGTNYFWMIDNRCLNQPQISRIQSLLKSNLAAEETMSKGRKRPYFMMMDEPGIGSAHVLNCTYCKEHFQDYLKKMKVQLTGDFTDDPKDGLRYYWSVRYRNSIMTEILRVGTDAANRLMPNLPTTVNFGIDLTYSGNLIASGCDWFEIFSTGALNYGWGEDWANSCKTYQVANFYDATLRGACRPRGQSFGHYDILGGRSEWEIQAKAYTHIGHGATCLHFFNYGPDYAISTDVNNDRPEIYRAIAKITHTTGAIEDDLDGAKVLPGDAAQLLSVTSDIWNQKRGNAFGKERLYLNLLLRHCNYRLDIISEQELATTLKRYRLLFVNDSHLLKASLPHLIAWLNNGGTLYLGPGALQFDEADQPLGFQQAIGLKRGPLQQKQEPGRAEYEFSERKVLGTFQGMNITCVRQDPLLQIHPVGKGKVIAVGCFPGISYMGEAKRPDPAHTSILDYPAAHRAFMNSLPFPVKPSLQTDNHRIEAHLLAKHNTQLIVLSNWTGRDAETTVTLKTSQDLVFRSSPGVTILRQNRSADQLTVKVRVKAGGYLIAQPN